MNEWENHAKRILDDARTALWSDLGISPERVTFSQFGEFLNRFQRAVEHAAAVRVALGSPYEHSRYYTTLAAPHLSDGQPLPDFD